MLDFMIATPKRHIVARNRVFWHILRQNRLRATCSILLALQRRVALTEWRIRVLMCDQHLCLHYN